MDLKTKGSVIFCLCTLILVANGSLTEPSPKNTAVENGRKQVILNCTATDQLKYIQWSFSDVLGSAPLILSSGSEVDPNYNQTYAVESPGNQRNLIILTTKASTAGTYFCTVGAEQKSAQLIVVNSAVCSSNVSQSTELFQNQTVQMTCTIEYVANFSYVGISISWSMKDPFSPVNSPPPQITTKGSVTTAVSTIIQQTGSQSNFPVYQSNTTFQMNLSNLLNGAAINTPNYMNSCLPFNSSIPVNYFKGSSLKVIRTKSGIVYQVENYDSVYQGESISCSVDANPAANYSWLDVTSGNTTNTSSIQIWHEGKYTCTAWNNVNSNSVTVNLTVQVTTTTSTTTITTTPNPTVTSLPSSKVSSSGSPPPGEGNNNNAIIIGVVVGVGGAILIVLIGVLIYCCIKKKEKSTDCDSA